MNKFDYFFHVFLSTFTTVWAMVTPLSWQNVLMVCDSCFHMNGGNINILNNFIKNIHSTFNIFCLLLSVVSWSQVDMSR